MPSACFDAIHNVSTPWKHAEGMSLRYAVIFGDFLSSIFLEKISYLCMIYTTLINDTNL